MTCPSIHPSHHPSMDGIMMPSVEENPDRNKYPCAYVSLPKGYKKKTKKRKYKCAEETERREIDRIGGGRNKNKNKNLRRWGIRLPRRLKKKQLQHMMQEQLANQRKCTRLKRKMK